MKKIKNIFFDLLIPFENFIHWNISKLVIFISSFLIGIIFIIPFLILFFLLELKSSINWTQIYDIIMTDKIGLSNPAIKQIYENDYMFFNTYIVLGVIMIIIFIIFYNYSNVLLAKLHLSYLEKKDFSITKNIYFNFGKIWKYFLISINLFLYLLIPFVIFFIGYFIILLVFNVPENTSLIFSNFTDFNYFSGFSFSLFALVVFCLTLFSYILYKMIFSYIILIDEENYSLNFSYNFYIKESLILTKSSKKFFLFLLSFLLLSLLLIPIYRIGDIVKSNLISNIKTINYSIGKIPILFPEKNIDKSKINLKNTSKKTAKYTIIYIIYLFAYFLIITGLINMLLVSFYRRFIIFDKKTIKHEKGISGKYKYHEKIKIVKKKKK